MPSKATSSQTTLTIKNSAPVSLLNKKTRVLKLWIQTVHQSHKLQSQRWTLKRVLLWSWEHALTTITPSSWEMCAIPFQSRLATSLLESQWINYILICTWESRTLPSPTPWESQSTLLSVVRLSMIWLRPCLIPSRFWQEIQSKKRYENYTFYFRLTAAHIEDSSLADDIRADAMARKQAQMNQGPGGQSGPPNQGPPPQNPQNAPPQNMPPQVRHFLPVYLFVLVTTSAATTPKP